MLREIINVVDPVASEAGVRVSTALQSDFDIHCAFERIVQVLVNLVSNAVHVTGRGGRVRIVAEPRGEIAWFAVEDEEAGSLRRNLAHVFDRGFRGSGGSHCGAGSGLAIAKGIVEAHGGCLGVESDVGVGTRFHFEIPMRGPEHTSWRVTAAKAAPRTD